MITYFVLRAVLSLPHERSECFGYAIPSGCLRCAMSHQTRSFRTEFSVAREALWPCRMSPVFSERRFSRPK